jgi:hypothetical protein
MYHQAVSSLEVRMAGAKVSASKFNVGTRLEGRWVAGSSMYSALPCGHQACKLGGMRRD